MNDSIAALPGAILLAGLGQIGLALGSLAIPKVLRWPDELARLRPLTRQVFWIYAAYIAASHLAFGLLSSIAPRALCDGTLLAAAVTLYIAAWWAVRLVLQFACLDRRDAPPGYRFRVAEAVLVVLFATFTLVYAWAAAVNLRGALA
jgi:hypothetical protein